MEAEPETMELVDLRPVLPCELLQPVPVLGNSLPRNKVSFTQVWLHASGAELQLQQNPGYYTRLQACIDSLPCPYDRVIQGDLSRTFPKERFFASRDALACLGRVLKCYARYFSFSRNPNVGYVQGFNFIAGRLLSLGFSEEQSFWLLAQIVETYLPLDYFYSMSGILIDQKVFARLMEIKLPKLTTRLNKLKIDSSLFCVQWFLSLFAGVFSQHAISRIWDVFFLKGTVLLPQLALALLFSERWAIKGCDNFNKMVQMLEKAPAVVHDPTDLLETALGKFRLEPEIYEELAASCRSEVFTALSERQGREVSADSWAYMALQSESVGLIEDYLGDENVPKRFYADQQSACTEPLMLGVPYSPPSSLL